MAGIGAAVATPPDDHMSDDKGAPAGQFVSAELPTATPMRVVVDDQKVKNDRQGVAAKPFCVDGNDGSCVSIQLPKVRMVRVPRVTGGQQELAKSGVAYPLKSPEKGNSEDKKAQKSTQRRNPALSSAAARREVRAAGWKARGHASGHRAEHVRQGGAGNFW
jgi:hypothetical protein